MRRQGPPGIDPALLLLRGALLTAVTLFLGVAGHVTGGGLLPQPTALVVLCAVTGLLSLLLMARSAGTVRLVTVLVAGQGLVHLVLSLTGGHHGDAPPAARPSLPAAGPTSALPVVDGRRTGSLIDSYAGQAPGSHDVALSLPVGGLLDQLAAHAPMMLAHVLAAALVGLWLAVGERALWTLVALACRRGATHLGHLVSLLVPRPVLRAARVRRTPLPPAPLLHQVLTRDLARRGPPALLT